MHKLQELIKEDLKKNNCQQLSQRTNVNPQTLQKIASGHKKFKIIVLERLYNYYSLPRDDFFKQNLLNGLAPSDSAIGALMRIKRIQKGYTLEEVARLIKGAKRNLIRVELGETLPSQNSHTINDLCRLYELEKDEVERIKWCIALLKDIVKIVNKYDNFGYFNKGHGE